MGYISRLFCHFIVFARNVLAKICQNIVNKNSKYFATFLCHHKWPSTDKGVKKVIRWSLTSGVKLYLLRYRDSGGRSSTYIYRYEVYTVNNTQLQYSINAPKRFQLDVGETGGARTTGSNINSAGFPHVYVQSRR